MSTLMTLTRTVNNLEGLIDDDYSLLSREEKDKLRIAVARTAEVTASFASNRAARYDKQLHPEDGDE